MYNIVTNELRFNKAITAAVLAKVQEMKTWIEEVLLPNYPKGYLEFTKRPTAVLCIHLLAKYKKCYQR